MRLIARSCIALVTSLSVALAGCATASKDIASAYVSPLQYQSYDCDQIAAELRRVQDRVVQLGGRLDEAASNDKAIMGVGIVLFWPVLFALGGTKQQEAEYARLKGEYEALQQAAIQKKCPAATTGATAARTASAFAVGDRLVYRSLDPVSGATLGDQTFLISRIDDRQVEYEEGALRTDAYGNWLEGQLLGVRLVGMFQAAYPGPGRWKARIVSAANPQEFAEVDVRFAATTRYSAEGLAVDAVRLDLDGFGTVPPGQRPVSSQGPWTVKGHVLVDAASGVLLELQLDTAHPSLSTKRSLVRRRPAGG